MNAELIEAAKILRILMIASRLGITLKVIPMRRPRNFQISRLAIGYGI